MVCKFCGNEIDDNSDFCFICGQKVEPRSEAAVVEPAANVYTQPEVVGGNVYAETEADATVVATAEVPEQPVTVPEAPAAFVAPVAPAKSKKELKAELKAAKKAAKAEKYAIASRAARFFSFIFALIGLIIYSKAKKQGDEEKAVVILNILMTGLCVKMGIVIIVMVKKFML